MSFAIFLLVGSIIGILDVYRRASELPHERLSRVDDAVILLMMALIGARLEFVLIRWPYFSRHVSEVPRFWLGGLGWAGAIIGSLLAIGLIGFFHRGTSLRRNADALLPLLCPLAVAGWLGAWTQNLGFGLPVPSNAWYAFPTTDSAGNIVTRFPLQPVIALLIVAVSGLTERLSSGCLIPGRKVSTGFLGFSIIMLVSTLFCADLSPVWLGFKYDSWFAAVFSLIGVAGYWGTYLWQTNFQVPQTSNTI